MGFELSSGPTFSFLLLLTLYSPFRVVVLFFTSCCFYHLFLTALLFASCRYPIFHVVTLHFALLLLSSLHCCSPFHVVVILFMLLLLSSLQCCFPHRAIAFLFALLSFPLHVAWFFSSQCLIFLFTLLFSSSTTFIFQVQGSLHYYSPLHAIIVGVLLFIEESCIYPMHSFLQELGVVRNQESKTFIFSISIFPFTYFHFFNFFISCLSFLLFF